MSDDRAMATIERITELARIPGADAIVRARVRGWDVVVKAGEFATGDLCVYFEVDALLDTGDERFAFLAARGVRTDGHGRTGHVLKTARLRGQYSQGLALPVTLFPELGDGRPGQDVTAALGVVRWDPPIPTDRLGKIRGYRPSWIRSTGQVRLQNQPELLRCRDQGWIATEKIDGTSTTYWVDGDDRGACTRNVDLLEEPASRVWQTGIGLGVHDLLRAEFPGRRAAVQGELYGLGGHVNPLRLPDTRFSAFTLLLDGAVVPRDRWPSWLTALSVPVHDLPFPATVDEALSQVDGLPSAINPARPAEGVVWVAGGADLVQLPGGGYAPGSFKVISNRYLLKNDR
ncbi:RNA ligase family protein [Actinoplanes utahensis]|uniref:RNA ligase family protein n=1 Tax=Actinoplanes utahensis TaxID=1869 RepID=UPI00068C14DA|nr:RNA ligase family protein [Actinoplanes utahensis]GIF33810.1 hypothetical protein Aut01nite_67960 [Actinoplanes utahensis]